MIWRIVWFRQYIVFCILDNVGFVFMVSAGDTDFSSLVGLLPDYAIRRLCDCGHVVSASDFDASQIQPSSLDLRLGSRAWRIRASFLPGGDRTVRSCFSDGDYVLHEIDLRGGAVLETGCVYLVCLQESLSLPSGVSALVNPKSSTGRIDVFTRVICDYARYFDKISSGYSGNLWLEISPRSFPILVREGSRLSQIRFRSGGVCRLSDVDLLSLNARETLVSGSVADIDGGIAVSVDIAGGDSSSPVGFCARPFSGLIDVDRLDSYAVSDYWEALYCCDHLVLDPGRFYIFSSRERICIPPSYAAEMTAFDPLMGEFRVHYAGFFDPGFGHSSGGGIGSRAVLEVRSYDIPFILENGQLIGRLSYESLSSLPESFYSGASGAHYQGQGLKLSKHFRSFE